MNLTSVIFWASGSTVYVERVSAIFCHYQSIDVDTSALLSSSCSKAPLSFTHARTYVACRAVPYKCWYTFRQLSPITFEDPSSCWVSKLTLASKNHAFSISSTDFGAGSRCMKSKEKFKTFWPFVTKNSHQPHGLLLHFLDLVG